MATGAHQSTTDLDTVDQSAKKLEAFAEQIKNRLVKIKGQVELLCKTYQGRGATAFAESMGEWDLTTEKVRQAIIDLGGDTKAAGATTGQGDASAAQNIRSAAQATDYGSLKR